MAVGGPEVQYTRYVHIPLGLYERKVHRHDH
jgi:hypothetical protein